jgi:hypothetical protein
MALNVLVIDSDVEALSDLAASLRARGLSVTLADTFAVAVDQAKKVSFDAILVAQGLADSNEMVAHFDAEPSLASLPCFELVDNSASERQPRQLPRSEPDVIARKLWGLESSPPPVSNVGGDFRGDLKQVSMTDLLQLLSMNHRTGTLTITTAIGIGEVRLVQGEIVDAIYRRVEGSKALYRLIGESEGTFAFMSAVTTAQRRVEQPTQVLLLEGLRQVDETRRRRQQVGSEQDALQSLVPAGKTGDDLADRVLLALEVPHTVDELLDLLPDNDLAIIKATETLINDGSVRRIERGAVRVDLADPDQLNALSNVVRRLRRPGFSGNPRVVLFASQNRLSAALHSLGRIADAWRASEAAPVAPVAHTLATLRLNDGAELDVVGLPDASSYCPLWGMTLPGSAAVVVLGDQPPSGGIETACDMFGIPVVRAEALLGRVEEGDPQQMALLVRAALEAAAGR